MTGERFTRKQQWGCGFKNSVSPSGMKSYNNKGKLDDMNFHCFRSVLSPAIIGMLVLWFSAFSVSAAITIPGADGSDGDLHITENETIRLSDALDGSWNAAVDLDDAGKGIYDKDKWAVVFKYSSVTIDSGATLSFSNHPSRAPVVWLVSGNVTINGTISLNGGDYVTTPANSEPGPGGFRGGAGSFVSGVEHGAGFGPGGGRQESNWGAGGSYGTVGGSGPAKYGNPSLIPLVGGSGGGRRRALE